MQWFHDRKIYLDALENQLRSLLKATETMVTQRKAMAEAAGDFSSALHALSTVELSPTLSGPLDALSDLQLTIRDVYDRQAQQDVLTLGIVIEEYIRLIGSVKQAFQQRQRSFHAWHAAEAEMQKRRGGLEKLLRQGRSQQDRLSQVEAEVAEAEGKVAQARGLFEDMGRLMRDELDRFEKEKVEDFKSGVETFLESAVEAQKEVRGFPPPSFPLPRSPFPFPFSFFQPTSSFPPPCRLFGRHRKAPLTRTNSSSKSGRPSSCSSTPRTTSLSSTARPSSSRPTRAAATRPSTARGRGWTTTRTRGAWGTWRRSRACILFSGSCLIAVSFLSSSWGSLCWVRWFTVGGGSVVRGQVRVLRVGVCGLRRVSGTRLRMKCGCMCTYDTGQRVGSNKQV